MVETWPWIICFKQMWEIRVINLYFRYGRLFNECNSSNTIRVYTVFRRIETKINPNHRKCEQILNKFFDSKMDQKSKIREFESQIYTLIPNGNTWAGVETIIAGTLPIFRSNNNVTRFINLRFFESISFSNTQRCIRRCCYLYQRSKHFINSGIRCLHYVGVIFCWVTWEDCWILLTQVCH